MDRCRYPSKPCHNPRALKLNGELHRFCEQHRRQANQNQMRWSKRKQTVRSRRGDGEEDDHARRSDEGESEDYAAGARVNAPPPPSAATSNMGSSLAVNVSAAGASLSHMSINNGHPAAHAGLISSYQDHLARGAPIPGANNVSMMMARSPMMAGMMERGRSTHMMVQPPIHQNPLPPILPPSRATEQPDPAVHALLMLERAANVVTMSQPEVEPANDDDVRRDLKRAKSNEWMPRPTLSPAGLPAVAALVNPASSIASSGRSASWQPSVHHESRESLGQWMQRKQASLPSISNLPRIEKRPYESISSSAPPPPAPSASSTTTTSVSTAGYPHRGMEPANARGGSYMPHPQHPPVPETHTGVKVESSSPASANRAAYV